MLALEKVFDVTEKPLVSIGVPTCERALLLERALKSLVAQDYPNIEIIVSDNASRDETPEICERILSKCPFVRYSRNYGRTPALENFRLVLLLSTGKYFMWAADDDLWEPNFVSTLVSCLESDQDTVMIAAEAQYMTRDGAMLPFFPEGRVFYDKLPHSRLRRLLMFSSHSYGNLIYGLYRREALFAKNGGTVLDVCKFINEIPIFLQVAIKGNVQVCRKVLFYKSAPLATYLQAAREYGFKPVLNQEQLAAATIQSTPSLQATPSHTMRRFAKLRAFLASLFRWYNYSMNVGSYHIKALMDIRQAIRLLDISFASKVVLFGTFTEELTAHFLKLVVVWQTKDIFSKKIAIL
jgi:glycosyltransferase involved in cell wall biosynthesis